jgi:mRNA interferase MazF
MAVKPKRGEVWWINFDPSIGSEIKKIRPAVVVSNDAANKYLGRFQVVPITSNTERLYPGESSVTVSGKSGKTATNQIATVSSNRFGKKIATLSSAEQIELDQALKLQLDL